MSKPQMREVFYCFSQIHRMDFKHYAQIFGKQLDVRRII